MTALDYPAPPGCVRAAWLTMGSASVLLDNPAGGYFVSSLDLGSPEVRAVTYPRPSTDGLYDLTEYMGGRVVSVEIQALMPQTSARPRRRGA